MTAHITADGLGIHFFFDRQNRVVTPLLARLRRRGSDAWGLRDVSFEIGPGDGVALLGESGSGKTTLLRMIAGVYVPDTGVLDVRGRVGSLLATDAGLLSLLTAAENAVLLSVLGGMSRREARRALNDVRERTELDEAFDHPVSSFSQGMRARLGFAVAAELDPEILLLDEVHEALDHTFRERTEERAKEILGTGGIVIAAGHDHALLERFCSRGLLLEEGRLVADGPFAEVRQAYAA